MATFPGATHAHLSGWLRVISRTFGHPVFRLIAMRNGTIAGVLPLVRVKSLLFGDFLVSMPYLNYGGPIGDNEAVTALAAAAVDLARAEGVGLLEMRSRTALPLTLDVSHRKITLVMPLPASPDELMKSFGAKLRSQVRRPGKDGLVARTGPDQLDAFFPVFAHHMRDLGTPALPRRLFAAAREVFGDRILFTGVWSGSKPVAGGCSMVFGDEIEMVWASSLREFSKSSPNMLLYWESMGQAMQRGLARYNFGRCSPGSATHRFKQQWGSVDEQLHWYQHSRDGVVATPSPDDSRYSLGPRLWRHLPVPLATALGPLLVRGIP